MMSRMTGCCGVSAGSKQKLRTGLPAEPLIDQLDGVCAMPFHVHDSR